MITNDTKVREEKKEKESAVLSPAQIHASAGVGRVVLRAGQAGWGTHDAH